jgi:DNA polymerase-3 subunit alpha
MAFVELEDMSGHCEIVVFPSVFKKVSAWLDQYNVFVVSGAVDITSQNKCKIKANQMVPIELIFDNYDSLRGLTLGVSSVIQKEQLDKIKTNLSSGKVPLKISFTENNQILTVLTKQKVSCSFDNLLKLQNDCAVSISIEF